MLPRVDSRAYWDRAAATKPAWFIATGHDVIDEAFFEHGAREVDELLAFCQVEVRPGDVVVEIGCGAGRMTRRLAELAGRVPRPWAAGRTGHVISIPLQQLTGRRVG